MKMNKILYMIKRVCSIKPSDFFDTVRVCHKASGKSSIVLFFDIIYCGFRYGCGRADYELFEFWRLNGKQRATYLTRAKNNQIVAAYNQREYRYILEDKVEFNKYFSQFLGRKWIDLRTATPEDFAAFMEDLTCVIAKPLAKSGGWGIEKVQLADFENTAAMFAYLKEKDFGLAEECIIQHPVMAEFNAHSVNTFRICTVLNDGEPHVLYYYVRMGSGKRVVDNLHSGGVTCPVDHETGKIMYAGYSAYEGVRKTHEVHPDTGHQLVGFQLPMYREALEMAYAAARLLPQVGYVGWDIAITEKGPVLIEGNPFPGHDLLQLPPHAPDGIGVLPYFRQFISFL